MLAAYDNQSIITDITKENNMHTNKQRAKCMSSQNKVKMSKLFEHM